FIHGSKGAQFAHSIIRAFNYGSKLVVQCLISLNTTNCFFCFVFSLYEEASPVILCLDSSELRAAEENIHPALTAFCLPAGITPVPSALTSAKPRSFALDSPLFRSLSPTLPTSQSPSGSDISLTSVFVPLEAIKPIHESEAAALFWNPYMPPVPSLRSCCWITH
uniref:Golgi associated, gamma adaptin ear containing, ARF binding protein 3a n=1 Tax=Cyprinus carpio carpio TaxID=630221 RepID=A0A9J7ZS56_CYPCA